MNTVLEELGSAMDDELMAFNADDFTEMLVEQAWRYSLDLYSPANWSTGAEPDAERLTFYLRRRAWAEWYFGTVTVSRQIAMIGGSEPALEMRLARQIQDEVRHHDVFADNSRRLGGEWRVEKFPEPKNLLEMRQAQEACCSVGELASANQLAGEVVLMIHGQRDGNVLADLVPDDIQEALEDVETDEPAHVDLGRTLVNRQVRAAGPDDRRRMAEIQQGFLQALGRQHVAELEQLGGERLTSLPEFSATPFSAAKGPVRIEFPA